MAADPQTPRQRSAGLPDEAFASDGLLTKRAVRAIALALLAPVGNELLWDLGAGSGSIGIEWCRLHAGNTAVAVERNVERLARLVANLRAHRVADRVRVVAGEIARVLPDLPGPDAVFVGGGVTAALLDQCWGMLPSGGRLVAHSVTADSDAELLGAYRTRGGELTRLSVETAAPLGRFTAFMPLRTVTVWAAAKA